MGKFRNNSERVSASIYKKGEQYNPHIMTIQSELLGEIMLLSSKNLDSIDFRELKRKAKSLGVQAPFMGSFEKNVSYILDNLEEIEVKFSKRFN